jgi:signal transduction histidine kinase
VFIIALFVSILLFSDAFLQLKTLHPRLHQLSYIFMALWLAALLLIPFTDFLTLSRLLVPAELITIGVTFIIGIYTWRKGFRPMGFFLLAWLGMAASVFLLLLVRLTVIPSTYITENLFQFGFVFMAVSWSIALADRINLLKIQTDQAYHDLRMSESKLNQILEGLPLGVVVYGKDQKPSYINKRTAEILSDTDKGTQPDPGAGRTLAQGIDHFSFQLTGTGQIYPLEDFPVQRALNGDPVFADNIEVKDGNRRVPLEMWASPVRDDMGNVESAIAAFQDITMRKQAEVELDHYRKNLEQLVKERTAQLSSINEQLDHEMEERKNLERTMVQRIEWLSTLNEIRQNLIGIDSLNEAYEQCSDAILPLLDAQTLFILRWDEQDFQFKMQWRSRTGTAHPKQEAFQKIFKKGSPLRKQLDKGKVILYSAEQAATLPMPFIKCFQMEDFNSLILSPMLIGQVVHGVLGITRAESIDELVSYQVGIVESIAYNLAHLIDDAVMLDQRRTLATIEERNRLARELHDSVAQTLYSISLFTDATRLALESNRPEIVRQHLDDLSELSQEAMSDMRMLIFELRPPILEQEGLAAALQSRLDAVESRAGVKAIFNTKGELHLTLEQESELFRIAQEALNNVVKHAHARQVRVDLIGQAQGIRMTIKDDGIGFHPEEAEQSGGQGFRNIRERAEILGAKYSINSNIGRGTKIVVEVNK